MLRVPFWMFVVLAVLYFTAVRVDMMEVDAAQYAEISREMAQTGEYLQVQQFGKDYLDKPPFLFWVSAMSMQVFGVNNLGYKLPSILFALWALYATYRLARLLYNEHVGRWSAIVLGLCQGMFLMTNDVRTDTILMSWVITAIWAIKEGEGKRQWQYVLLGGVSVACGMMTKGPIALLVPAFCYGSEWVVKRKWKLIFSIHHLFDFVLIGVLLLPMSVGLYQQYGMEGLRFYYWTQSFGRITGENQWHNSAGFEFLFSNMFWSFMPWIFFLIPALCMNVYKLVQQKFRLSEGQEFVTTGGFILTYVALGSSQYQLPHYIFVVFPLAAIMVAALLYDMLVLGKYEKLFKVLYPLQVVVSGLAIVAAMLLLTVVFPGNVSGIVFGLTGAGLWLYLLIKKGLQGKVLWLSVCGMVLLNAVLSSHFYPELLQYQASSNAGRYIREHEIAPDSVAEFRLNRRVHALHYYANGIVNMGDTLEKLEHCKYFLTNEEGRKEIASKGYGYTVLKEGKMLDVSKISLQFLNPKIRNKTVTNYYLLAMKK